MEFKNIIINNIRYFKIYVNDVETKLDENFSVKPNDIIKITNSQEALCCFGCFILSLLS